MNTGVVKKKDAATIQKQRPFFVSSRRGGAADAAAEDTPGPGAYTPPPSTAALEAAASSSARGSGPLASHAVRLSPSWAYTGPGPGSYTPAGSRAGITPRLQHPGTWQTFPRAHDAAARPTSPSAASAGNQPTDDVPGPGAYGAPCTNRHGGRVNWGTPAAGGAGGRGPPGTAPFLGSARRSPGSGPQAEQEWPPVAPGQEVPLLYAQQLAKVGSLGGQRSSCTSPYSSTRGNLSSPSQQPQGALEQGSRPSSSRCCSRAQQHPLRQQARPASLPTQIAAALAVAPPTSLEAARAAHQQLVVAGCHGSTAASSWARTGGPGPGAYDVATHVSLAADLQKKAVLHGYVVRDGYGCR